VREVSLWLDEPYTPRAALDRDLSCDVCVVGAGIGGLATAWQLVSRGIRDVVVVDRGVVAGGASGRNGGFFIAGAAPMYDRARELWGRERARAIYAATLRAQLALLEIAAEVGARDAFRLLGMLRVDDEPSVRAHLAALHEDGFEGSLVTELPGALRGAGLLTPHDGAVHPAHWLRALARGLAARGCGSSREPPSRSRRPAARSTPPKAWSLRARSWSPPTRRSARSSPPSPPACARGGCTCLRPSPRLLHSTARSTSATATSTPSSCRTAA
jgi:hypothetical protein